MYSQRWMSSYPDNLVQHSQTCFAAERPWGSVTTSKSHKQANDIFCKQELGIITALAHDNKISNDEISGNQKYEKYGIRKLNLHSCIITPKNHYNIMHIMFWVLLRGMLPPRGSMDNSTQY